MALSDNDPVRFDTQTAKPDKPIGSVLRATRIGFDLSILQVEDALRIQSSYIEALEDENFAALPAQIYAIGYLKSYAEYLGLDAARMSAELKRRIDTQERRKPTIFPVVKDDQKLPGKLTIFTSVIMLSALLLGWKLGVRPNTANDTPPVPKELSNMMKTPEKSQVEIVAVPVIAPAGPATATQQQDIQPVAKAHPVILHAAEDVWLEIRDAESKPLFSRVLKTGEEYWVPPDAIGYQMTTGNAGGLQVLLDGTLQPALGRIGEVKRRVSLNAADLRQMLAIAAPVSPAQDISIQSR